MKKRLIYLDGVQHNNTWRDVLGWFLSNANIDLSQIHSPAMQVADAGLKDRNDQARANATDIIYYLGSTKQSGSPISHYWLLKATLALADRQRQHVIVVFDPDCISGFDLDVYIELEKMLRGRFPNATIFSSLSELVNYCLKELRAPK